MANQTTFVRRAARQTFVLILLVGLIFAAGIDWAAAATSETNHIVPGVLHVIVLFSATIAFVVRAALQTRKPARVKTRHRNRH